MNNSWNNRQFRDSSHVVQIEEEDQKRLNLFFRHELALYNTLVEAFGSRTRGFPNQIAAISDKDIQLFGLLSEHSLQLKDLCSNKDLPPSLKDLAVQYTNGTKLNIPAHLEFLMSSVLKERLAVLPATKKLMIDTVCRFYREQADILKDPSTSTVVDMSYRAVTSNLSKMDITGKRHAQITRRDVSVRYIPEDDTSELIIPLCKKPLKIYGVNLNEREGWSLMVLRQEPGRSVDYHTPWLAEFKRNSNQYLIKLTDFGSRKKNNYGSSFTTSKAFG